MLHHKLENTPLEAPFPLLARFKRQVLPVLLVLFGLFILLSAVGALTAMREIYLELAQRRAESIARSAGLDYPDLWNRLMTSETAHEVNLPSEAIAAIGKEVSELKLIGLKIYNTKGRTLFSLNPKDIGKIESSETIRNALDTGEGAIISKTVAQNQEVYELYVPLTGEDGETKLVFELYEPIQYLNAVLIRNAIAPVAVPTLLLLVLIGLGYKLSSRAQRDINRRTEQINALRQRLESLVSRDAVDAVRNAQGQAIASRRKEETLFYSDIRDFTGLSENHDPEEVIHFLNDLMALQIDRVKEHGGDVDKMVGDALLVRFSGEDKEESAVAAAEAVQRAMRKRNFERGIGIGLFTGPVIAGAIGPEDRRDYTVIGDSVNISARLCSAAGAGEVVMDEKTAQAVGLDTENRKETVAVKGRKEMLEILRLKP